MIRTATVEIVDFIIGIVTYIVFCIKLAPSISTASNTSPGIILRPAINTVTRYPNCCQKFELKDDDDDDFIPEMKDELYQADDSEIEEGGFTIEDAPDDLGADFGDFDDSDDNSEEDM